VVDVLIADLHENAAALGEQLPRQQQAVAQVGEVGVDAQLPSVPEGADLLRLGGQVRVLAVLHIALVDEGLEVRAVLDAVGRVEVDHLHLASHALLLQQRVHHQQAVARHHAVAPAVGVLVELDGLPQGLPALGVEQHHLRLAAVAVGPFHRLDDAARVDALVGMQRYRGQLERGVLGLTRPL